MRRLSTSSSDTTSTCASDKPLLDGDGLERRGLRQKARDVVSDLGRPPTARQDAREGKHTSNFMTLGFMGDMKAAKV